MKVACQMCEKIVNTEQELKGNTGFEFSFCFDNEPYVNFANKTHKNGYLCYECSVRLAKFLKYRWE